MAYEKGNIIIAEGSQTSFETVLDETCKILEDKQIQYFLKRIGEYDRILEKIEEELDIFLGTSPVGH